jgi:hypothetical protein
MIPVGTKDARGHLTLPLVGTWMVPRGMVKAIKGTKLFLEDLWLPRFKNVRFKGSLCRVLLNNVDALRARLQASPTLWRPPSKATTLSPSTRWCSPFQPRSTSIPGPSPPKSSSPLSHVPSVLDCDGLAFRQVELDRRLARWKEGLHVLQHVRIVADHVDVIEVSENEPFESKGRREVVKLAVGYQERTSRLAHSLRVK